MKKVLFKLPEWWKAETPVLARFFQIISSAIAACPCITLLFQRSSKWSSLIAI